MAGAGGYPNLHRMAKVDGTVATSPVDRRRDRRDAPELQPRDAPRFLRLAVSAHEIRGVYTTVPRPQESWSEGPVQQIDKFTIDIGSS